jgi:hypothetical protein
MSLTINNLVSIEQLQQKSGFISRDEKVKEGAAIIMLKTCPECKVPEYVHDEHIWLNNGDIIQKREHRHRLVLIDSENLDPLFKGIEQVVGTSIDHIVIGSVRKNTRSYLSLLIPDDVKEKVCNKEIDYRSIDEGFKMVAKTLGFGRYEFVDHRYEGDDDDYCTATITEPFSLPITVASHAAAIEAIQGRDHSVIYAEEKPGVWKITAFPQKHAEELKGRLQSVSYKHREGDIELERCSTCGCPKALGNYRWYIDRGIILNEFTKRRMAIFSPQELDPIFQELELELGDTIPSVVVEAQRRFTKTGFYSIEDIADEGDFRTQFALRGLGNMREIKMNPKGLFMRLENTTLHLMIVGMIQGIFEMAFDVESTVGWRLSEEGDLEVEVFPIS